MASTKRGASRAFRIVILTLALIGIALSAYLLKEHYALTGNSFCDINATISCDVVNQSSYAELFGLPVSALGILFYLVVASFALFPKRLANLLGDDALLLTFFLVWMIIGFGFSLYLMIIEAFVLHVYCPLCVTSALIVTTLLIIGASLARTNY